MTRRDTSEIRELEDAELDCVSGGWEKGEYGRTIPTPSGLTIYVLASGSSGIIGQDGTVLWTHQPG